MPNITEFPLGSFYERGRLDEVLARNIGGIVLLHERINRRIAQIYKVASGHNVASGRYDETFWRAYTKAKEHRKFSDTVSEMCTSLSRLLEKNGGNATPTNTASIKMMGEILGSANKSRNLVAHSAYGFDDPSNMPIVDEWLASVYPLPEGSIIREYFNGADVVVFVMQLSELSAISQLQISLLDGLEALSDSIANYSVIIDGGDEVERETMWKEISAALEFWDESLVQRTNAILTRLQEGESRKSPDSIVRLW